MLRPQTLSKGSEKPQFALVLWTILVLVLVAAIVAIAYATSVTKGVGLVGLVALFVGTFLYADHAWRALPQKWKESWPSLARACIFLAPASVAAILRMVASAL